MKFKLSPLAPSSYTHAVITQGTNGIRQRFLLNFDSDTVYDTADFESQYPVHFLYELPARLSHMFYLYYYFP